MKIAIASKGAGRDSQIDDHFGRAHYFVLVDSDSELFSVCGNSGGRSTPYTAGMQTAGTLLSLGVKAVIAANIGSKALATLQAAGVPTYRCRNEKVEQALDHFKRGMLPTLEEADACEADPPARFRRQRDDGKRNSPAATGKRIRVSVG
ncbi:MAG: dinitrogenase iron-molybdenum cofactor biosynthesis protein [Rhodopirellula sp.]|nr:dinitrogenase iron-molybdenum cofactor biosynthesis protein [Rhodopirellula sp.]